MTVKILFQLICRGGAASCKWCNMSQSPLFITGEGKSYSDLFIEPITLNGERGLSLELGWGLMSSCHPKISTPVRAQAAVSSGRQEQWKKQAKHLLIFVWRWLIVRKLSMTAELSYWSVSSCGLWERPFCPGCQSAVISQKLKWYLLIAGNQGKKQEEIYARQQHKA